MDTTSKQSTNASTPPAPKENRATRRLKERQHNKLVARQEKAGTRPKRLLVTCSGTYGQACANTTAVPFAVMQHADHLQAQLMPAGWRLCVVGIDVQPPENVFTFACPVCVSRLMQPAPAVVTPLPNDPGQMPGTQWKYRVDTKAPEPPGGLVGKTLVGFQSTSDDRWVLSFAEPGTPALHCQLMAQLCNPGTYANPDLRKKISDDVDGRPRKVTALVPSLDPKLGWYTAITFDDQSEVCVIFDAAPVDATVANGEL